MVSQAPRASRHSPEQAAGENQRDAAVVALEQRRADFLFKAADAAAQSGRADVAWPRWRAEMQAVGQVQEVSQGAAVHGDL
jgi:hypothetical protein